MTILIVVQACLLAFLFVGGRRTIRAERAARRREAAARQSHARIRELAGGLIAAQETERRRIARDLHDGACQEIAGVAIDVSHLRQRTHEPESEEVLLSVERRLSGVAESLRVLSHDLHPAVLRHVGLVAALQAHCTEVERRYGLRIGFHAQGGVEPPSDMAALSLFRIAQEALRNASRHGHAQRVTVSLTRNEDALTLSIADDGVGFAPETAGHGGGLGLMSIEERALLLNGRLTVRSQPLQGTTIEARVPLHIEENPQPADVERKQTPPLAPARDERSPSRSPTVKSSG